MKIIDYIVFSIMAILDIILFIFRGCTLDTILFVVWLGVIAISIIAIERKARKEKENNLDENDLNKNNL